MGWEQFSYGEVSPYDLIGAVVRCESFGRPARGGRDDLHVKCGEARDAQC